MSMVALGLALWADSFQARRSRSVVRAALVGDTAAGVAPGWCWPSSAIPTLWVLKPLA